MQAAAASPHAPSPITPPPSPPPSPQPPSSPAAISPSEIAYSLTIDLELFGLPLATAQVQRLRDLLGKSVDLRDFPHGGVISAERGNT